jgi:hypothetical protein
MKVDINNTITGALGVSFSDVRLNRSRKISLPGFESNFCISFVNRPANIIDHDGMGR